MDNCGFGILPTPLAVQGELGVHLFFCLSGFLIATSVMRPQNFDLRAYSSARARRVLPNYYLCAIFCLLLVEGRTIAHASPGDLTGNLFSHALLMHAWFGEYISSIMGPLWTLSHEWIFYLLMAACAGLLRSKRWWILPLVMLVIAIVSRLAIMNGTFNLTAGANHPACFWDQFAMGITAAWIARSYRVSWPWTAVGAALVGYVLWVRCGLAFNLQAEIEGLPLGHRLSAAVAKKRSLSIWHPLLLGLGCSMLVAAASQASDRVKHWSQLTPLPWMGKVSYSTYLWHMPVVICFMRAMRQLPANGTFQSHAFASSCVLLGVYLVSAICYAHFEKPWVQHNSIRKLGQS